MSRPKIKNPKKVVSIRMTNNDIKMIKNLYNSIQKFVDLIIREKREINNVKELFVDNTVVSERIIVTDFIDKKMEKTMAKSKKKVKTKGKKAKKGMC